MRPPPPAPPLSPRAEVDGRYWRLDTVGLVRSLKTQLNMLSSIDASIVVRGRLGQGPEVSGDVVEKLTVAWSFSGERGHPRLRMRHAPYAIGPVERDAWLLCMRQALIEQVADDTLRAGVDRAFEEMAQHMVNTGAAQRAGCAAGSGAE